MSLEAERLSVERSEFSTSDPDAAEAMGTEMFGAFRPKYGHMEEGFTFDGRRTSAGDMCFDHLTHSSMSIECAPLEFLMFFFVTAGDFTVTAGEQETRLRMGDTALCPAHVPVSMSWDHLTKEVICLPLEAAEEAAVEQGGSGRLKFLGTTPVSPAMDRYWRSTAGFVASQFETPESPLAEPLVYARMLNLLGTAAVKAFPNTTMTDDYQTGPGRIAPAVLRRAVAVIEYSADRPLTLTDIATAVSVSPQALQQDFVRQYGTSPLGYLRRVRLDRARRDLQAADPASGTTVGPVAARWGFPDAREFSGTYQEAYGHPPERALRT